MKYELAIIGGGPAGLTAGIYSARLGLKSVIFEKHLAGGTVREAPWIENFPGAGRITGEDLAEKLRQHALEYVEIKEGEEITRIEKSQNEFLLTGSNIYSSDAIILATGSLKRKLGVPGEREFLGRGVSYCATCDGYFFRGKRVAVIGGGNSAVIDAIYLRELGCEVFLIHRRTELRAEHHLQKSLGGVKLVLGKKVEAIVGDSQVRSLKLVDIQSGKTEELEIDGVFVAVGEEPNSSLAKNLGVRLSEEGYILTDNFQRTTVPFVYAAGDVTSPVRQIVVACSQGAVAAISAFEDLKSPYWRK